MTVRAMTKKQAKFVLKATEGGVATRHSDLVKASAKAHVPFLFMMPRCKQVERGFYDFALAKAAAKAVLAGKPDPQIGINDRREKPRATAERRGPGRPPKVEVARLGRPPKHAQHAAH